MTVRSEKELLVASREFTREQPHRSWGAVASTFGLICALAAAILAVPFWPARLALGLVQGLVLVRGFCLFHDFQHGALLRGSKPARALFFLYGELLLVPPSVWRESHNYHHAHTAQLVGSHIGSYPMLTPSMYAALSPRQRWLYRAARHPLNIVGAVLTVFALGMCLRPFLRAPRKHWQGLVSLLAIGALAAAAIAFGHGDLFVWAWLLPLTVATAVGAYLFYAQHNYPGVKVARRESWTFSGAALDSSSHMTMGPLLRWLTANIGLHHVHHLNSAIPFYRLPEAMAAIGELQQPGVTSLRPRDIAACFRLKLWDPEKGQMVGYP
jgi:omega-6 fatty acid desaturase (delta-12 desaturase)